MLDKEIIDYIQNKEKKCSKIYFDKLPNNIIDYLNNRYNDSNSLQESYYRILNNIEIKPKCKYCNNDLSFRSRKYGYNKTCKRKECKSKNYKEKYKNTCLKKYGVKNAFQSKEIIEKIKQTFFKKYGMHPNLTKEVQEKYKNTCLKKYGVKNAFQSKEIQQKYHDTMIKKYGVYHNWQLPEEQEKSHSKNAINKCFETQKKNHTLNTSKLEEESFILLKEKYKDTIHYYKDKERYPFVCDFYIPSLDLFIECQYSMFHNKRPYLGIEEDLKEIEILKQKSIKRKQETGKQKSRYDSVIDTWVNRDPLKRKIAKQNNLNYLEFFTILEFENWLNNYESK